MVARVLLVDDHDIIRFGLDKLLQPCTLVTVVGQASNGLEAIDKVKQLEPDIIVMDVSMPGMNGIEATRVIKADHSHIEMVIQSMHIHRQMILASFTAGAKAYVPKESLMQELIPALRAVLRGQVYLSHLIKCVRQEEICQESPLTTASPQLTSRERQVLQLLAEGKSSQEMGTLLGVGKNTIITHRQNIMNKLNLRSVAQLTKYAIQEGITSLELL